MIRATTICGASVAHECARTEVVAGGVSAQNRRRQGGLSRCWLSDHGAANRLDLQGAYFDGSLELLRELAVTSDLDVALPRLSTIVSKMLPHDALRIAWFDQQGQLV